MRPRQLRLDDTPVTWVLVLAYVTILVLSARYDDESSLFSPSLASMVSHGAAGAELLVDEPWRLLTSAFAHFGVIHLGFNLSFLVWMGPQLEREVGSIRFALIYAVTAVGGSLLGMLWSPMGTLAGGSGALFGMMGAALGLMARRGRSQLEFLEHHGARNLMTMIASNLVLSMLIPMISNSAHIGGLISGFCLSYWFLTRPQMAPDGWYRATQAALIAILAATTLYMCRPVLRVDWHLRMVASPTTPIALREEHARVLGMSVGHATDNARSWARELALAWGETGRRLERRWFDD